ncbi:MAG: hypothetical protein IH991_10570, partial [Planctomycetes bacterium]|nr:hypothetical protein [Planctomycetota bacterium]
QIDVNGDGQVNAEDFKTVTPSGSGETTATVSLNQPHAFSFAQPYLLVVADPENTVAETLEDNNTAAVRADVSFTSLNTQLAPGFLSADNAFDISFDGSVVVGHGTTTNGIEAYRWARQTGIQGLGDFPGGSQSSQAFGVSADGSVVAGFSSASDPSPGDDGYRPFRWTTQTNEIVQLSDPTGVGLKSATAISADGSVIAGGTVSRKGFVWKEDVGAQLVVPAESPAISGDGKVVGSFGVRWTEDTGLVSIGSGNSAHDISFDGSVIVGQGSSIGAFRWTAGTQAVSLGFIGAAAVSDDGTIVVGQNFTGPGSNPTSQDAIIWDEANGPRKLKELLVSQFGLDLTGWTLQQARAISGDGRTIAGPGINPAGQNDVWVVQLDGQPELPDIEMLSAQLVNSTTIEYAYETTGLVGDIEIGLFRSANEKLDADDERIPVTISAPTGGEQIQFFDFGGPVQSDSALPYILVVADPNNLVEESDEQNNLSSFVPPQVVFLDYENSLTFHGPIEFTSPEFRAMDVGLSDNLTVQLHDGITTKVQELFSGINVRITDTQPTEGPFTTVFFGGSQRPFGRTGLFGEAEQVDIGNRKRDDDALVFTRNFGNLTLQEAIDQIGVVAAHEVGHAFGAQHLLEGVAAGCVMERFFPHGPTFCNTTFPLDHNEPGTQNTIAYFKSVLETPGQAANAFFKIFGFNWSALTSSAFGQETLYDVFIGVRTPGNDTLPFFVQIPQWNLDSPIQAEVPILTSTDEILILASTAPGSPPNVFSSANIDPSSFTFDDLAQPLFALDGALLTSFDLERVNEDGTRERFATFDTEEASEKLQGEIQVDEASGTTNDGILSFPPTSLGATSTEIFTITNSGPGSLEVFPPVASNASAPFSFQLAGTVPITGPIIIPSGDSLNIFASFSPSVTGQYQEGISINSSDAAAESLQLLLQGLAVPTTVEAGDDKSVVEGDSVDLAGASFTYSGDLSDLSGTVNWGDETNEPISLVPGTGGGTFANSHVYTDDRAYTVSLTLSASEVTTVEDSRQVLVSNVAPTIVLSGAASVDERVLYTLTLGPVTDPGQDTVTHYIVNWDDGVIQTYTSAGDVTHAYADGPATHTIEVALKDEDGTHSGAGSRTLVVNDVAPTIALSGAASVDEGALYTLTLGPVTDPGQDTVTQYIVNWDDGAIQTFANAGDVTHAYADGPATRAITVDLKNEDGTHSGAGSLTVAVENVAPTIALSGAASVDEGALYTLTLGLVTDPGQDTVTGYIVNWDDGTIQTFTSAGDVTHTYADGPATRTISVSLKDEDGTHANAGARTVQVNNVPPEITQLATSATLENKAVPGETVTLTGKFKDLGSGDTHTATVDWNDGTPLEPISIDQSAGTFDGTHTYVDGGIYTITVTLIDDDGGFDVETTTAVITGVGVNGGVLQIVGTSEADHVTVNKQGNNKLKVHADFLPSGNFVTINLDDTPVDKIIAYLCEGDDHMT